MAKTSRKISWRPHFSSGILTCFIKPKYRHKVDSIADPVIYKSGGFYTIIQGLTFFLNFTWVVSLPFLLFDFSDSLDGFIRISVITFIFELIYKMVHADYRYF